MGTGILPVALLGLPVHVPGAPVIAAALWVLAAGLLLLVVAATAMHHRTHPDVAADHRQDPVRVQFYGAPAMALMTVGAGALLAGEPLLGHRVAVLVAAVLWVLGTALGLLTTVAVPVRMIRTFRVTLDQAFGGWLMPVVPPMVSAATGALLVEYVPAGQARQTFFLVCCALMAMAAVAASVVIVLLVARLVRHGVGAPAMVPTWWIVLGPLGQAVTAGHHLAVRADLGLGHGSEVAIRAAVLWGLPVLGVAALWSLGAALLTQATVAGPGGLPFSLTWWSFTFPVATVVTGFSAMADLTGSHVLAGAAVLGFAGLVTAWCVVAPRTLAGVISGHLLRAPQAATPDLSAPAVGADALLRAN